MGVIGAVSCGRFLAHGWVAAFWTAPRHHFHWPGLWWVRPLPAGWMEAIVALIGMSFLWAAIAAGWTERAGRGPMLAATIGFMYLGMIDVAPYLNHYVLLSLLALWCAVAPTGCSVPGRTVVPPRLLLACVYVWAAIAKVDDDWLSGRTLRPWLAAHVDLPVVGSWLSHAEIARMMACAGLAFDATIVVLLSIPRLRRIGFGLVVGFHLATALLFPIGVFPWLMIGATTIFAAPEWANRWWPLGRHRDERATSVQRAIVPVTWQLVIVTTLAVVPLRGYLSDVGWSEQGGRFAWRVMAVDKVGLAELRVAPSDGRPGFVVHPERDLSPLQVQQVAWQPDLILQWAHLVAAIERRRLGTDVAVYADVWVSWNGRPPARLVDDTVDLTRAAWTFARPGWVLAAPS